MLVLEALAQEYEAISSMLGALDDGDWARASLCEGWTVADVVLHLAQTEEGVVSTTSRAQPPNGPAASLGGGTIDDAVEQQVTAERGQSPRELLQRWRNASARSLEALRAADPAATYAWATNPLKPQTLATTRLSEHWIHANDIAQPLGIDYPDTERLWHIARLAQRTIPYAFARAGRGDPPSVHVELTSPAGEVWTFGEAGAQCVVRGSASQFCRIAARRLSPKDADTVVATGARGAEVLELVRTYA